MDLGHGDEVPIKSALCFDHRLPRPTKDRPKLRSHLTRNEVLISIAYEFRSKFTQSGGLETNRLRETKIGR